MNKREVLPQPFSPRLKRSPTRLHLSAHSEVGRWQRCEIMRVPDVGQIGAGGDMDFIPTARRVKIVRPRNCRPGDQLISALVAGDSLSGDGIDDGDRLVCRLNFEAHELKQGRLVVVRLPTGGHVVKHFYLEDRGAGDGSGGEGLWVRLRSSNPEYDDLCFEFEEVRIAAVVIESVKRWD